MHKITCPAALMAQTLLLQMLTLKGCTQNTSHTVPKQVHYKPRPKYAPECSVTWRRSDSLHAYRAWIVLLRAEQIATHSAAEGVERSVVGLDGATSSCCISLLIRSAVSLIDSNSEGCCSHLSV